MSVKLVEKPKGFDLRDKRSDKSNKGTEWTAQDALYSASQEIAKQNISGAIVIWREKIGEDSYQTHFRYAGDNESNGPALCMSGLGKIMEWGNKS